MRILIFVFLLSCVACATPKKLNTAVNGIPKAPDYANPDDWAALPTKKDEADRTPTADLKDNQANAAADVFFLHPTMYTSKRNDLPWNGAIDDPKLNAGVDERSILNQASIFNAAGRVYAPRYRQAHLDAYYIDDKKLQKEIFDLAYQDVKTAFEYFLKNYNKNRPIIIASHSQGTTHAKRLLKDFFDGKALQKQLVAAYIVGIPVEDDYFEVLKPCQNATETGCFVTWRSYRKGSYPAAHQPNNNIVVTNPLTWTTDTTYAAKTLNEGSVLLKFEKLYTQLADAQVQDGVLWITKPKFFGSFVLTNPNYHIADFNFFYANVRKNAVQRVEAFLEQR